MDRVTCRNALPFVRRTKEGLEFDRENDRLLLLREGGNLACCPAGGTTPLVAELRATLLTQEGRSEIRQGHDVDPRLVICEQGPVRTVVRAQFDLLDTSGRRWGEGLTVWMVYRGGPVVGGVSMRLINADGNARLADAHLHVSGAVAVAGLRRRDGRIVRDRIGETVPFDEPVVGLVARHDGVEWCLSWPPGPAVEYVGGKGPWQGFGDSTPYYEDWGVLSGQGAGDSGWNAGAGAGAYGEPHSVRLAFMRSDEGVELAPVSCLFGQIMWVVSSDKSDESDLSDIASWLDPVSLDVEGGAYRGFGRTDAMHQVYAPDARELTVTVPAGPATNIHVYGLSHWGGWTAECDGRTLPLQLVNDGRGCDDPNGLQLGRFDDRHGPIVGKTDVPANRLLVRVPGGDTARTVVLRAVEGLALSYLRWDDRQMYLVQSSANPNRNLAELCVRDGKLRHLAAPHSDEAAIAAMPLYWYQCNTPTPYRAVDDVTRYVLLHPGPDAIAFEVHARNRYDRATGVYRVRIPFDSAVTRVEVEANLEVKKTWLFQDLQILNLFAEEFRDHRLWVHEYALAMDAAGKKMLKRPKEGRSVVEGDKLNEYTPPLLFAQYSARRGNIFLAQTRMEGPVSCHHMLCPHWVDSHYHGVSPTGRLESGDRVSGAYTLLIDDGRSIETSEVEAIGRRVVDGMPLMDAMRARA